MHDRPKESDWKRFRKMVPDLRERYLKEKTEALAGALTDSEKTPTERFWDTFEAMKTESRILRDCLDGHSRSKMTWYLSLMCRYGMIERADLAEFSSELQAYLEVYLQDD